MRSRSVCPQSSAFGRALDSEPSGGKNERTWARCPLLLLGGRDHIQTIRLLGAHGPANCGLHGPSKPGTALLESRTRQTGAIWDGSIGELIVKNRDGRWRRRKQAACAARSRKKLAAQPL